jgi:hypothetical protein
MSLNAIAKTKSAIVRGVRYNCGGFDVNIPRRRSISRCISLSSNGRLALPAFSRKLILTLLRPFIATNSRCDVAVRPVITRRTLRIAPSPNVVACSAITLMVCVE